MTDPRTPEEWQEAVDGAHALLTVEAAKQYGLVTGGPTANVTRCEELLARGKAKGILPTPGAADRFVALWNGSAVKERAVCN